MAYKLIVTEDANADIDETIDYIVNILHNPIAAANLLSEIEKAYDAIIQNPDAFAYCNDRHLREKSYRKTLVKNYIIFYHVDHSENTVYILRVLYGRRDYINLI